MQIPIQQSSEVKTFAFSLAASEQKDGSLDCIRQSSKLRSCSAQCLHITMISAVIKNLLITMMLLKRCCMSTVHSQDWERVVIVDVLI